MAFLKAILETVLKAAVTGVAGFAGVMLGKKLVKRKESKKLSKEDFCRCEAPVKNFSGSNAPCSQKIPETFFLTDLRHIFPLFSPPTFYQPVLW